MAERQRVLGGDQLETGRRLPHFVDDDESVLSPLELDLTKKHDRKPADSLLSDARVGLKR